MGNRLDAEGNGTPAESTILDKATDIVCRFSRCGNYPKTTPEMQALANDLISASENKRVSMEDIAQRWAERSAFCPTAADLFDVALEIRTERQEREAIQSEGEQRSQWKREAVPDQSEPKPDGAHVNAAVAREAQMWRELRKELNVQGLKWPGWAECAKAARKLGYGDYAVAWERSIGLR